MFPLLEVVVVKGCPRMEHFSFGVTNTTILRNVQFDGENHWEGELNGTIKKLFDEKVCLTSIHHFIFFGLVYDYLYHDHFEGGKLLTTLLLYN
jgi:hypothetical protein